MSRCKGLDERAHSAGLFSEREVGVLTCIAGGMSADDAATFLGISLHTVTTYKSRIVGKVGGVNIHQAVLIAWHLGCIDLAAIAEDLARRTGHLRDAWPCIDEKGPVPSEE